MVRIVSILVLLLQWFASVTEAKPLFEPERMRGLRVDPGRLYELSDFAAGAPRKAAEELVTDLIGAGFNTVFIYAYSPIYGAYYRTRLPSTHIEPTLGRADFLTIIIDEAKRRGLKVVASFPLNDFLSVWSKHPEWRARTSDGREFTPIESMHLLSTADLGFRAWYVSLVRDFVVKHPAVDALELVEPLQDPKWQGYFDWRERAALQTLAKNEPSPGPQTWRARAKPLTDFIGLFASVVHEYGKEAYIVQTWPAKADGRLMTSDEISALIGLDFEAVLSSPPFRRPDALNLELMWQQWRAEHGTELFTPAWSLEAANKLSAYIEKRAKFIVHLELSHFNGPSGPCEATVDELLNVERGLTSEVHGFEIYDYLLWKKTGRGMRALAHPSSEVQSEATRHE